jgi:hypothetical protein
MGRARWRKTGFSWAGKILISGRGSQSTYRSWQPKNKNAGSSVNPFDGALRRSGLWMNGFAGAWSSPSAARCGRASGTYLRMPSSSLFEVHVEHFVGFIECDRFEMIEVHGARAQMIMEPLTKHNPGTQKGTRSGSRCAIGRA